MNAVSIPGSEEFEVLSPSCIEIVQVVNSINVRRWILNEQSIIVELHGFADASELAYGAVIYVESINSYGDSEVKLLISKSRVEPLKFVTIPRLELCAAVLLSKLMRRFLRALKVENPADLISRGMDPVKLQLCELWWSPSFLLQPEMTKCRDSSIETNDLYIRELKSNPSDLLSRGLKVESLQHHEEWWNGPSVLQSDELPETVCER
ncbi:hypothetical protein AVEN_75144-1 [Araneus ventricosus]|uniref:Uncharacterized protein n=1 Tax=Araneus ventricosus TaxID=182803 RepID=A0A4Y2MXL4_ARAVE|nr:hypothetical protein AVEN_75144-1 [Araneus ventricosus]